MALAFVPSLELLLLLRKEKLLKFLKTLHDYLLTQTSLSPYLSRKDP